MARARDAAALARPVKQPGCWPGEGGRRAGRLRGPGALERPAKRLALAADAGREAAQLAASSGEVFQGEGTGPWRGEVRRCGMAFGLEAKWSRAIRSVEGLDRGGRGAWDRSAWVRSGDALTRPIDGSFDPVRRRDGFLGREVQVAERGWMDPKIEGEGGGRS